MALGADPAELTILFRHGGKTRVEQAKTAFQARPRGFRPAGLTGGGEQPVIMVERRGGQARTVQGGLKQSLVSPVQRACI